MFSEKELNLEEHEIREVVRTLPASSQFRYHELEVRLLKRPSTYKALNWLFPLGVHHFYLGRWIRGLITLSLSVAGVLVIIIMQMTAYGLMLLLATVLIEIPQLLNARLLVHSRNNRIMAACLKQVQTE